MTDPCALIGHLAREAVGDQVTAFDPDLDPEGRFDVRRFADRHVVPDPLLYRHPQEER